MLCDKNLIFSSHDKSWQWNLMGFIQILAIFNLRRRVHVSLQKQHRELLQKHAQCGSFKHKHRLEWLRSTPGAVSEPYCTDMCCSVNCLSMNGRQSHLYLRAAMHKVFLGGYCTLKTVHMTFYIHHVTCKCKKKKNICFHCRFAN